MKLKANWILLADVPLWNRQNHYELFTTAGAIFREKDRTNLYSQWVRIFVN